MAPLMRLLIILSISAMFLSCGVYGFRGNNPPEGISKIFIQQFEDLSGFSEPTLAEQFTQDLKVRITSDNTFRIAEKVAADASLVCKILTVVDDALVIVSGETVTRRKVTITVSADFLDLKKQKSIWKKNFTNYGEYVSSSNDFSERANGVRIAVNRIAEDIMIDLTSNW